jgi:hypothetical protein
MALIRMPYCTSMLIRITAKEMYRKTLMGPESELLNGIFSRGFTRVFVWFFTLVFLFYKMLFMNRLAFSCFADFFAKFFKPVWFEKFLQENGRKKTSESFVKLMSKNSICGTLGLPMAPLVLEMVKLVLVSLWWRRSPRNITRSPSRRSASFCSTYFLYTQGVLRDVIKLESEVIHCIQSEIFF